MSIRRRQGLRQRRELRRLHPSRPRADRIQHRELGYTGDTSDSASMNVWLHKQVLRKLADNGGRVPAELLD